MLVCIWPFSKSGAKIIRSIRPHVILLLSYRNVKAYVEKHANSASAPGAGVACLWRALYDIFQILMLLPRQIWQASGTVCAAKKHAPHCIVLNLCADMSVCIHTDGSFQLKLHIYYLTTTHKGQLLRLGWRCYLWKKQCCLQQQTLHHFLVQLCARELGCILANKVYNRISMASPLPSVLCVCKAL